MENLNLNKLFIPEGDKLENHSVNLENPHFDNVEVLFKDIEYRLIDIIDQYKEGAIFGCIAWLTSFPILNALSKCNNVQIIVQKEDFLRPDLNSNNNAWKKKLQKHYKSLKCDLPRWLCRYPISSLSTGASLKSLDPIRCIGNHNSDKQPAFPRSHHKFLVFCELSETITKNKDDIYRPTALWTGSFNLTKNSGNSLENVLFLTDKSGNNKIFNAFLKEHHQIFALSEKLNWENEWIEPEYELGRS